MRKAAITALALILVAGCGGSQQGESEKGFIVKPGELTKFDLSDKSYNTNFNGPKTCSSSVSCYAVISKGTAGGISYVGISVSDNPNNETFNIKIYIPNISSIPSGDFTLTQANSTIKVKDGGTIYSTQSDDIVLNFSALQSDNTYIITGGGDNSVTLTTPSSELLVITDIRAIYYGD